MTTQTQNSNVSSKKLLDVHIEPLHESKKIKAFKINIKEGKFIVLDYKDRFSKNPDTEIFWEHGYVQLSQFSSEFKAADKAVNDFLKRKNS